MQPNIYRMTSQILLLQEILGKEFAVINEPKKNVAPQIILFPKRSAHWLSIEAKDLKLKRP